MKIPPGHVYELEGRMIAPAQWEKSGAPGAALEILREETAAGYPVGLAHSELLGWCVLATGQGPFIAWSEHGETA